MMLQYWWDESTKLHQNEDIDNPYVMLHRIDIQPGKATKQLKHHTFHMPTCIYKFSTLHIYTNDYPSIAQICRLVRDIDFGLIICIK